MAAAKGHLAVVRYLVQQGADINKANNTGCTPLDSARGFGHAEVAAFLRAAGAR